MSAGARLVCATGEGDGASPGDALHPEPYLYVVPWGEVPDGPRWRARGFAGAELGYGELLAAADQRGLALAFFAGCLEELTARAAGAS